MIKYEEPEVVDPHTLSVGDQVGRGDSGLMIDDSQHEDPIWMTLLNAPGQTTEIPEYDTMRPLPRGNTGLHLTGGGQNSADQGWVWGVLPRVLARRAIR